MKFLKISIPIFLLFLTGVAIMAPIGPLPGFFIHGTPTEVPASWPDTSDEHEILLQVDGVLPRVVIIWVVDYENDLYVFGGTTSSWVQLIGESAPVKMRLDNSTFDLIAERVTDDLVAITTAYRDKYRADYPEIIESGDLDVNKADESFRVFRLQRPST